jgi:hypothetical protein
MVVTIIMRDAQPGRRKTEARTTTKAQFGNHVREVMSSFLNTRRSRGHRFALVCGDDVTVVRVNVGKTNSLDYIKLYSSHFCNVHLVDSYMLHYDSCRVRKLASGVLILPSLTSGPAAFPACSSFLHGAEGTIMAALTALAGIGSKNLYLMLELKHGPAT